MDNPLRAGRRQCQVPMKRRKICGRLIADKYQTCWRHRSMMTPEQIVMDKERRIAKYEGILEQDKCLFGQAVHGNSWERHNLERRIALYERKIAALKAEAREGHV